MDKPNLTVVPYDPLWPENFKKIKDRVFPLIAGYITGFEHVGSTAVEGLAAKPVIDIDAIFSKKENLPEIISRLEKLGYVYEGDKGIPGREAFKSPSGIKHHLYVCEMGCLALRNHIAIRDYLRTHPDDLAAYGKLKLALAPVYLISPAKYVEAKTEFLTDILKKCGIDQNDLDSITIANRVK